MPSLQDIADQINGKLDAITTNTGNTAANTATTNGHLSALRTEVATGIANLAQGLFAILEQQRTTNHLLEHNRKQNDTIICELQHANELLCGITRKLGKQLHLSQQTLTATLRLEGIEERAHAAEAGDYDRDLELKAKIEKCCPPRDPPEEACPPNCGVPGFDPRRPEGQKWEPIEGPRQPDPIG
jgi:hypothetical protein